MLQCKPVSVSVWFQTLKKKKTLLNDCRIRARLGHYFLALGWIWRELGGPAFLLWVKQIIDQIIMYQLRENNYMYYYLKNIYIYLQ